MKPFGFRVLVEVKADINNILADRILTGIIIELPNWLLPPIEQITSLDNSLALYYQAKELLRIGTKIVFNNEEKLIHVKENKYSVPIELIREYSNE